MPGWSAVHIRVRGVVQGVGFRPFVFRLAREHAISGWVLNEADGVHIHAEGRGEGLAVFVRDLERRPPEAAHIDTIDVMPAAHQACTGFSIRDSAPAEHPTTRVSPDLPVCRDCLAELFDPANRRAGYPCITCTNCGPRYSIVLGLPYDRPLTTMRDWPLCAACASEYHDPGDRRFHAQPLACPSCGPSYVLYENSSPGGARGEQAITMAASLLRRGAILAVKGIGGYHLACAARDAGAVLALRERKFRKEKPFAVMVRDVEVARALVDLNAAAEALLTSPARPIVVAAARDELPHVASGTDTLGVMLPYAPLHHLVFAAGAPDVLVMTSGNASSEPIAYDDEDARARLSGIADAWLVGERRIARRVEDSIARAGAFGPVVLRRARGYAPGVVARLPSAGPVLAMGADVKAAVTLLVGGEAVVGPHIGDLEHHAARQGYEETIRDLLAMWQVDPADLTIVHDAHPEYVSTRLAQEMPALATRAVQHHRAHVASVLAERMAFDQPVVGVVFDGTGYGDDGTIWGGEFFAGSLADGFARVAHLHPAPLPGGDAAARHPAQAAAGFVATLGSGADVVGEPFALPLRFRQATELIRKDVRVFRTTSAGRLFDAVAALLGFTRETTFEAQAAMWLEHRARASSAAGTLPFPFMDGVLDFRPALQAIVDRRRRGDDAGDLARAFHRGLAAGVATAARELCDAHGTGVVVLSGGVFQNELLLADLRGLLADARLQVWTNQIVPPNDGGLSLGQAALVSGR